MKATRTTNPLHFEDLEPHRFEDLVRQLAYSFRNWLSLEATGRSGSDEGIDIRGVEISFSSDEASTLSEPPPEDREIPLRAARTWIIQCKREKAIPPKKLGRYVEESLNGKQGIHGFILAAATDFSMKARAEFRERLSHFKIHEGHLWGKAELEDMLFQPFNDHLLFAYFGISLAVRRRNMRMQLVSGIAMKRKLVKFLPLGEAPLRPVLLRDPRDEEYPFISDLTAFRKTPKWLFIECNGHLPPGHLQFLVYHAKGWVNWETGEWDIPNVRLLLPENHRLHGLPDDLWATEDRELKLALRDVPDENRADVKIWRFLAYDRILAVDDIGDAYNEGVHILVERDPDWSFFEAGWVLVVAQREGDMERRSLLPEKRKKFFPSGDSTDAAAPKESSSRED